MEELYRDMHRRRDEHRRRAEAEAHQRRRDRLWRDTRAEAEEQQRRETRALRAAQEQQQAAQEQQRRETSALQAGGTQRVHGEGTAAEMTYDSLPPKELRVVAQGMGLSTEGNKATIIQRLREDDLTTCRRYLAATAEQANDMQPVIRITATRVTEADAREMENAQKVADDYDAREAQRIAAVYEANERGTEDMNRAREAQQMADDQEAMEAAQRVADEMEAKEENERR